MLPRRRSMSATFYGFAILHGERLANPADEVGPASVATFVRVTARYRRQRSACSSACSKQVPTLPTIRSGLKLYLLLMVRKSELQDATCDEVDFETAVWSIPRSA